MNTHLPAVTLTTAHYCHPIDRLDFLVIEGPAGSGKSTVIRDLIDYGTFQAATPIADFPRPRSYDGGVNLALSIVKDGTSLLSAMVQQMTSSPTDSDDERIPFIVDRYMVSQMVYGRIRRGFNPSSIDWILPDEHLMSVSYELTYELQFLRQCYHLLLSRDGHFQDRPESPSEALRAIQSPRLNLVFAILLPEVTLLEEIRRIEFQKTGRRYPYVASQEIYLYQYLADTLTQVIQSVRLFNSFVAVRCFRYSNFEERDRLPSLIQKRFQAMLGY